MLTTRTEVTQLRDSWQRTW